MPFWTTKPILAFAIAGGFLFFASIASSAPLVVLGDRKGEVEPCGCPRVQLGGLDRLVGYIDSLSADGRAAALIVDTGNTFFALPQLPPTRTEQAKSKAALIAQAYRLLGVRVLVPGPNDFALGQGHLENLARMAGVVLVAANLKKPKLVAPHVVLDWGRTRLGVTGWVDPDSGLEGVGPGEPAVRASVRALKEAGATQVLVLAQSEQAAEASRGWGADWVVGPPSEEGKELHLKPGPPLLGSWQRVALGPEWEKPGRFEKPYAQYLAAVRRTSLASTPAKAAQTKQGFVANMTQCRQCHAKQTAFWETTKHASAYLVLHARDQIFNPECVSCHSLGYQASGGFSDIGSPIVLEGQPPRKKGETPFVEAFLSEVFKGDRGGALDSREQPSRYASLKKRYHESIHALEKQKRIKTLHMGVQCEHCHGNRAGHPGPSFQSGGKVTEQACLQCHVPPHDPTFDFSKRVQAVACPKR